MTTGGWRGLFSILYERLSWRKTWHYQLQMSSSDHPHNSNPKPASAAALLKQQLAATSAAGAFDADSKGSDATAE